MRRLAGIVLSASLAVMPLASGFAQERETTLADIRQELSALYLDIQRLKRELSTTAAPDGLAPQDGVLSRVDAIEGALQRLTGKTEELEFRITRIVADGTRQIGDLEFRICDLETSCDPATLGETPQLGGVEDESAAGATPPSEPDTTAPGDFAGLELAVGERDGFTKAQAAFDAGSFAAAADAFGAFVETYPGSPLGVRAMIGQGDSLGELGQQREAARAYLEAFSAFPDSPQAPTALFRLGRALGQLGQIEEACLTLAEVGTRFPDSTEVPKAATERDRYGCT